MKQKMSCGEIILLVIIVLFAGAIIIKYGIIAWKGDQMYYNCKEMGYTMVETENLEPEYYNCCKEIYNENHEISGTYCKTMKG